jgi:hypothetical protein
MCSGAATRGGRQGLCPCTPLSGGKGWASALVLVLAYSLQCGWPYAGQAPGAGPLHSFLYWRTRYNVGGPTRARRQGLGLCTRSCTGVLATMWVALRGPGARGWASALVLVLAYSLQCGWPYAGQAPGALPLDPARGTAPSNPKMEAASRATPVVMPLECRKPASIQSAVEPMCDSNAAYQNAVDRSQPTLRGWRYRGKSRYKSAQVIPAAEA